MSEITPASSPNRAADSLLIPPSTTSTGVDLAPVVIRPSRFLWRLEFAFYLSIFCAATIALFPFFLTAIYWPTLWLIFSLLIVVVLRQRWHAQKLPAVTLRIDKQIWQLKNTTSEFTVAPFGEILMWEYVIILSVREMLNGRKHYIVALPDSMSTEDWRRLRVWLRTGLRNNL